MKIQTGQFATESMCQDPSTTSPSHRYIFDGNSHNAMSGVFVVQPGQAIMLSAYDLQDVEVTVEGVSVAGQSLPQGSACCTNPSGLPSTTTTKQAATILHRSPMTLGGRDWKLTKNNSRLIISLPGTYVATIKVEHEIHLGQFFVELINLGVTVDIPDQYIAGV